MVINMSDIIKDILSEAISTFALKLYSELIEPDQNLFFSPFSIFSVLSIAYVGARSSTETQMT